VRQKLAKWEAANGELVAEGDERVTEGERADDGPMVDAEESASLNSS
jgi:hypothetical protein